MINSISVAVGGYKAEIVETEPAGFVVRLTTERFGASISIGMDDWVQLKELIDNGLASQRRRSRSDG